MRLITVSLLSIFACMPAFANARLPVVNVAAGSVSARAAFGEETIKKSESKIVAVAPVSTKIESNSKAVVARATAPIVSKDSGEAILARAADVLTPRRPSSDLWARAEKPLRLPEPQEISVLRADYDLPEESLDIARGAAPVITAPTILPAVVARSAVNPDLDTEIAKLVDLQRQADNSVKVAARAPSSINSYDLKPSVMSRAIRTAEMPKAPKEIARAEPIASTTHADVSVGRVVVPMDSDVIVRPVIQNDNQPKFASADDDMAKMSPGELKKAFKKTYLSENKHLSTFQIDDRFDVASDLSSTLEGFTSSRDLSESGGVRPLEIKIGFRGDDSALSRENYNLLSEYASIVVSNPKRAIQVSIPQHAARSLDDRKLAARRLAIVEQVLRDTGVSDQRIMPVLSQRSDDSFVLRVISSDQYEILTQQKRDMFGDNVGKKTYKSMTW